VFVILDWQLTQLASVQQNFWSTPRKVSSYLLNKTIRFLTLLQNCPALNAPRRIETVMVVQSVLAVTACVRMERTIQAKDSVFSQIN
jgi:hypothetical protein